jgi:hypothetical protein
MQLLCSIQTANAPTNPKSEEGREEEKEREEREIERGRKDH